MKILVFSIIIFISSCTSTKEFYGQPCPFIGIDYIDRMCSRGIIRTWCVVDWCKMNVETGRGIWYYTEMVERDQAVVIPMQITKRFVIDEYYN